MVLTVVQGKRIICKNFCLFYVLLIIEKSIIIWVLVYLYTPSFPYIKLRLISRNPVLLCIFFFFYIFPIIDIS